jgi:hypothetical protein
VSEIIIAGIAFIIGLLIGWNTEVDWMWGDDEPPEPCEGPQDHDWKMCTNHVRCAKCGKIEF